MKVEYIKKIDLFLEEIGVNYIDIRMEMLDHLASEIEEKQADLDTFFKYNKLETPFVKFMFSKKYKLKKAYKKQVRYRTFYDIKKILLRTLYNIPTLKGLLAFLVVFLMIKFIALNNFFTLFLFSVFNVMIASLFDYDKKIKDLKMTKSYYWLSFALYQITFFTFQINLLQKTLDNEVPYIIFVLAFFQFLVTFTFYEIRKEIIHKYKSI